MRRILIAAGVLIALVLVAVGAVFALFDANAFREPVRAQLEKQLGRPVTVRDLGLKLFPLSIRLDDVTVGESPQFAPNQRFAAVKELAVRIGLAGLIRKQVNVESIRVVQPEIELIRNAAGEWNFSTLGGQTPSGSSGGGGLSIADLKIEDARLAITDQQNHKPRTVYPHIDASLANYAPGKQFTADLSVRFAETGKQRLTAHAAGTADDLNADVALEAVSLPALMTFAGASASGIPPTTLDGKAKLRSNAGKLNGSGTLTIAEKQLKSPAQLDFELAGDTKAGVWSLPSAKLKVGALAATGKAEVHTTPEPGTINGELRTDNASLAELLQLASAFGVAADVSGTGTLSLAARFSGSVKDPAIDAEGTLREARLNTAALRKPIDIKTANIHATKDGAHFDNVAAELGSMRANGSFGIRNFARPQIEFAIAADRIDADEIANLVAPSQPNEKKAKSAPITGKGTLEAGRLTYNQIAMTNVHAACELANGEIRLDPVTAKLFGGDQAGAIVVDTRGDQNGYAVRARLAKVDANQLLSAATSVRQILFGTLSANVDLKAAPRKDQQIASALNGTVQFQLADGKLAGVQLVNEMASIAKFLGYTKRSEVFTNILKLAGTVRIDNGVANTDDLAMDFDGGSMTAAGSIGLSDQQLKMKLTTILAKAISERAGGTQVGGIMNTVLANPKGELIIPSLVGGTLSSPKFMPDPERIAKMKVAGLLPSISGGKAGAASAVQGVLDALRGTKPAAAGQPQQAESGAAASGGASALGDHRQRRLPKERVSSTSSTPFARRPTRRPTRSLSKNEAAKNRRRLGSGLLRRGCRSLRPLRRAPRHSHRGRRLRGNLCRFLGQEH